MQMYGLRRDEALRVTYELSKGHTVLKDGMLEIRRGWGKGTVERVFAMRDGGKIMREVSENVRGFEIKGRIENFRSRLDYAFRAQIKPIDGPDVRPHGLRHTYNQKRYFEITGRICPAAGGTKYTDMTKEEKAAYDRAAGIIAQEAGHTREEISSTYIGK